MSAIPTWVYTATTIILIGSTAIVAYKTQGGIKHPLRLLVLTLVTVSYIFSLTFIQNVQPQLGLDLKGGVSVVLEAKGNPSDDQLDLAVDVIRERVDALGVAEPEISRQGNDIVVDLPGAKDTRKAQKLIGQTAELRFRQVAENQSTDPDIQRVLAQIYINEQAKKSAPTTTTTTKPTTTTTATTTTTTTVSGSPGRSFHRPAASSTTTSTTVATTTTTPTTTTTVPAAPYPTSIVLQCGGSAPQTFTMTGDLTQVTAREKDAADLPIIALDKTDRPVALCPAVLKGDIVKDAVKQVDNLGAVSVGVELTSEGARNFTQLIGVPLANMSVAIVLDSVVISAPQIQPELADGLSDNKLQITIGDSENQNSEVEELVTVLKYGKLPVVLEQQTAQQVSPTLGTDQLRAGLLAGLVGLILVIIYMLIYYRILALVVIAGIGLTGMTVYALISWLGDSQGLSLTLAGAVGLIVSVGVTVDSYVVYFEKLKDEVRQGRSVRSSLDSGFKASFKTILAADLVSLIGAAALFYLASGSVRGFAFFLGVSTVLDLLVSICFMHPMVKLIAQKKSLITNRYFGVAVALDKKDLTA
ncbi:MAG TPA: protein translocase subunit SecD [Acidimicrobiia bacterium]|nr:protein translocase subunit SecD [Acidimicrobiia bacterium]